MWLLKEEHVRKTIYSSCSVQIENLSPGTTVVYTIKNPKISDTQKFAVITLKVEQDGFSLQ